MRAASELAVNQPLVERDGVGTAAWMRRIRRDLNCVLVTVMMVFEDRRRSLSLLDKTLSGAAAEIDHSGNTGPHADAHHVQNVLDDIKLKIVLLLNPCCRYPYRDAAVGNRGAKDRHARFVSRSHHAVFRRNLGQLAAEQMEKLAR